MGIIDCEVAAIALNTSEVWDPTPKENKEHNQILDNIIKRTLKTPRSTPREALYIETGMLDLEARRHKNRINMRKRVMEKSTESTKITMNAPVKGGWSELTDALDARYGTANKGKEAVSKLVGIGFQKKIHTDGEEKSKIKYLLEGRQKNMEVNKKAEYLEWLNRNKASAVFLTRTRMFPAKNNFRSAHPSLTCRFCPHDEETQEHLLQECPGVHSDETTKVKKEDFFPQKFEYPKIWQTAANIEKVLEKIKKRKNPERKGPNTSPSTPALNVRRHAEMARTQSSAMDARNGHTSSAPTSPYRRSSTSLKTSRPHGTARHADSKLSHQALQMLDFNCTVVTPCCII